MTYSTLYILEVLMSEHLKIKNLFEKYANSIKEFRVDIDQHTLAHDICHSLYIHIQLEKELLFPVILKDKGITSDTYKLIMDATARQSRIEQYIVKITKSNKQNKLIEGRVMLLYYLFENLVEIEENQIFPDTMKFTLEH